MWQLFENKKQIALDHIRYLFALTFKYNKVSCCHSSFDFQRELLCFLHQTYSTACLAALCKNFTLALAGRTWLLNLHLHHAHVYVLSYLSLTLTSLANAEFSALCTTAPTLFAVNVSSYFNDLLSSQVQVF